jgi:hypothetical protein
MLEVQFRLQQLRCDQQFDWYGSSEPFLWVLFFALDITSIRPPDFVRTVNMLAHRSGKGVLAGDVRPGTVVEIPEQLGGFRVLLEEGIPAPLAGFVVALLEDNGTADSLVRNGHLEFGAALHEEINRFVRENPSPDAAMTEEQRAAMIERIERRVRDAIARDAGPLDYFSGKDQLVGFDSLTFGWPALDFLRNQIPGEHYPLASHFRWERTVPAGMGLMHAIDDYTLTATISVATYVPPTPGPPDPCAPQLSELYDLERQMRAFGEQIAALQADLATASPAQKQQILAEIRELQRGEGADLRRALVAARAAYNECRAENPLP